MASALLQLVLLDLLGRPAAYPQRFDCNYACMAGLAPGGSFGNMGIPNFASTTGSNCVITTSVPASGYLPGQTYVVTVASSTALGRKIASDRAGFAGQNIVNAPTKATSSSHNWMATADSSATFRALCGAGGNIDKMYVASAVAVQVAQTTTSTTTATTSNTSTTTSTKRCLLPLVRGDEGYTDGYRGWYDVQGCGRCHDYCRWVGTGGVSRGDPKAILVHGADWWSCRLAGSSELRTNINHFQFGTGAFLWDRCASEDAVAPASPYADGCKVPLVRTDAGAADNYRGWYDVQGCGRCFDYCRWVGAGGVSRGDPKTILVHGADWWSCRLAGSSNDKTDYNYFQFVAGPFRWGRCTSEGAVPPTTTTTTTTTNKEGCKVPLTRVGDGYAEVFRGWYDVQGCGRCHDYCRWVGGCGCGANCGDPMDIRAKTNQHGTCFWSCRLAGSTNAYTANGHFTSFTFAQCESEGALAPPPGNITEYIPGDRGAPWTQAEMLVVRAKIHRIILEGLAVGVEHGLANYTEAWTEIPNSAKLLRLGFHDCMRYTDGTGGCDGCLEWTGVGVRYARDKMAKGYFTYSAAQDGANNGLANSVAILDALYTDRGFPHYTRPLPISLQQGGKSRADVWAFATLVAVEYSMEYNNRVCKEPETDLNNCHPRTGMPDCIVQAPRPFIFSTGRRDCVSTGAPWQSSSSPSYKTAKPELHADPHGNGNDTLNFFKKEFKMNGRETVAIMGAHTIGRVHAIHSLLRYSWKARSTGLFNNGYFRNIASKEDWYYDSALFRRPCLQGAVGNSSGKRPIARWMPHVRGDMNTGGPVQWLQEKFVCPTCSLLVAGSAEHTRCCVGVEAGACKPGCEQWKFVCGVDEQALSAEMGLYKSFQVNATNSIPYGCRGFEQFNMEHWGPVVPGVGLRDHSRSWTIIDNKNAEPQCGFNTHADAGDLPLYQIVELYASDQAAWLADFFPVLEKMLANGYAQGDLEVAPSSGMTDFVCPPQSWQDAARFYTCSVCAGCDINRVPVVTTTTTTTTSTNSTTSSTTTTTTTRTTTTTTSSSTTTMTTQCFENPRSNHICPKFTTTLTSTTTTITMGLTTTASTTSAGTISPTVTECVDNPRSNHVCPKATTMVPTTAPIAATTVVPAASTTLPTAIATTTKPTMAPIAGTTVVPAASTTLPTAIATTTKPTTAPIAATAVSTTTVAVASTMVATAVTTTVSLTTVTTVVLPLVSVVSTSRVTALATKLETTSALAATFVSTTTAGSIYSSTAPSIVTSTSTTTQMSIVTSTSTTASSIVVGSFQMSVPNFIATEIAAEVPATKLLFAKALARTIGLEDWRLVRIKSIYIDGVKVARRLQHFITPRRLSDKKVKIDYDVNTTKQIDTSKVNAAVLKADVQKEAVAIGKNDWAAAIASSGDWQILSTGRDMAISPQTQIASTTVGDMPSSTTTATIAVIVQANTELLTTEENGSMVGVIAGVAVGSCVLVVCCLGVLGLRLRRKPTKVRGIAALDEEVEFDSPHMSQPEHTHGRAEASDTPKGEPSFGTEGISTASGGVYAASGGVSTTTTGGGSPHMTQLDNVIANPSTDIAIHFKDPAVAEVGMIQLDRIRHKDARHETDATIGDIDLTDPEAIATDTCLDLDVLIASRGERPGMDMQVAIPE